MRRLLWNHLNGITSDIDDTVPFYAILKAVVAVGERAKDEMSSAKVWGRYVYSAEVSGPGVTQSRVTAFAVPRSEQQV